MSAGSRTLRHFREPGGVCLLFRQTGPGCAPADQTGEGRGCTEASRGLLRLDEFLDEFESTLGDPVERSNEEIGEFRWSGDRNHPGFELSLENLLVHMAGFEG